MRKSSASTISMAYDYRQDSPASLKNAANYHDNHYTSSLFGDPVVPPSPNDFLENLDSHLYGNFRRPSAIVKSDDPEVDFPMLTPYTHYVERLHSPNITVVSDSVKIDRCRSRPTQRVFSGDALHSEIRHLPKIRVLPGSGSTGHRAATQSADSRHLNLLPSEVYTSENQQKNEVYGQRRISEQNDGFQRNFTHTYSNRIFSNEPIRGSRRESNELHTCAEWFKPSNNFQEWTKIPRLRPSSKNVMSINQTGDTNRNSPLAKLFHDSNGSSSAEEKVSSPQKDKPAMPLSLGLPPVLRQGIKVEAKSPSFEQNHVIGLPPSGATVPHKRDLSPTVLTNAITTGSEYRINAPRSHKQQSFTILTERSSQNSRLESPKRAASTGSLTSLFGCGFKETSALVVPTPTNLSPSRLRLPSVIPSMLDDSLRPSVQFNISSIHDRFGPSKGILHCRTMQSCPIKVRSYETIPKLERKSFKPRSRRLNKSSLDLYGELRSADPRRSFMNPNPTSQHRGLLRIMSTKADYVESNFSSRGRLTASVEDLSMRGRRTSISSMRSMRRRSSTSPERRSSTQTEPRSSIASDRRSSNLSSVTTSDFSLRKQSLSPIRTSRRKSVFSPTKSSLNKSATKLSNPNYLSFQRNAKPKTKTQRKVAKPTTLSPIIGTPNKDVPPNSDNSTYAQSSRLNRRDSISKIPVRGGSNLPSRSNSRIGSRVGSRVGSQANSRANSPIKDLLAPLSRPNSRATSRSNSRVDSLVASRAASRAGSRVGSQSSSRVGPSLEIRSESRVASRSNSRTGNGESPKKSRTLSLPRPIQTTSRSRNRSPVKPTFIKSLIPSKLRSYIGFNLRKTTPTVRSKPSVVPRRSTTATPTPRRTANKTASIMLKKRSPERLSTRTDLPSAKKTIKSVKTRQSSVRMTPSSVEKSGISRKNTRNLRTTPFNLRKETSVKRELSNLKLEGSTVSKKDSGKLKREMSTTNLKANSSQSKNETGTKLKLGSSDLSRKCSEINLAKKLEKKDSFKKNNHEGITEDNEDCDVNTAEATDNKAEKPAADLNGKLIPMTKANVVSMTTAAITSQPVQIQTTLTNQIPLGKSNSQTQINTSALAITGSSTAPGDIRAEEVKDMLPTAILEKSTRTLENIQKTVTEATKEIHKTINENLTDLKTLEIDMGKMSEDMMQAGSVSFQKGSFNNVLEHDNQDGNLTKTADQKLGTKSEDTSQEQAIEANVSVLNAKKSSDNLLHPEEASSREHEGMAERVSERAISVLPEVECESANLQTNELDPTLGPGGGHGYRTQIDKTGSDFQEETGHTGAVEGKNTADGPNGSQEYLEDETLPSTGCCGRSKCGRCCTRFCMPCRRLKCSACCKRLLLSGSIEPIAILTAENETQKSSWKRMECCRRKRRECSIEDRMEKKKMKPIREELDDSRHGDGTSRKSARACLSSFFCCRATNKVESTRPEDDHGNVSKCCFHIPCGRKKTEQPRIWQKRRESIISVTPQMGRCARFMDKLKCWKKKAEDSESRRQSMNSKKQSIAPTLPPEDTRPKLHIDLVEFNSKMKGAIPVMPLWLAWFCMIFNTLIPGLGTILSGIFCVCVGIPRFSQYDSARARIGSFVINCIIGIAQLFCVLFCFVGWGWSIWWGTIMLKTARKLKKIKHVEQLELQEEQRQADLRAAAEHDVEAAE